MIQAESREAASAVSAAMLLAAARDFVARSIPLEVKARWRRWLTLLILASPILFFLWPQEGGFSLFLAQLPIRLMVIAWIGLVAFVVVFAHELGHAIGAVAVGGGVRAFCVKPFVIYFSPLRFRLFLRLFPAGFVMPVPVREIVPWRDAIVTAGGVLANAATGLAVYLWHPEGMLWAQTAQLFVGLSIYNVAASLVPLWLGGGRTDGAWLLALARGQTRKGFYACTRLGPFIANGVRPRDWPQELTREIFTTEASGSRALFLRSLRFSWHLDHGEIDAAANELQEGLQGKRHIGPAWPSVVATVAWFVALFRHDAKAAREILALLPPGTRSAPFVEHRALAAIHWADGAMAPALAAAAAARRAGRNAEMPISAGEWERLAVIETDAANALGRLVPA